MRLHNRWIIDSVIDVAFQDVYILGKEFGKWVTYLLIYLITYLFTYMPTYLFYFLPIYLPTYYFLN